MRKVSFYERYRRYKLYYEVMYKWMLCDIYNRKIEDEFLNHGIGRIAIYGMGDFGVVLFRKLQHSNITVTCFIDKYSKLKKYGINELRVITVDELEKIPSVDAVIISSFWSKTAITKELRDKGMKVPVYSLEDIIMKM